MDQNQLQFTTRAFPWKLDFSRLQGSRTGTSDRFRQCHGCLDRETDSRCFPHSAIFLESPPPKLIVTSSLVISGFLSPMPPLSRGYCWALFVKTHPSPSFCGIIFTAIPPTLGLSRAPPQLLTLAFETFWALYFLYTLPSPLVISPNLISQSGPQQVLPCQNMHAAPYIERWV